MLEVENVDQLNIKQVRYENEYLDDIHCHKDVISEADKHLTIGMLVTSGRFSGTRPVYTVQGGQ